MCMLYETCFSSLQGLYPESHGIVDNYFYDKVLVDSFYLGNNDPKWWLGEPVSASILSAWNFYFMEIGMGDSTKAEVKIRYILLAWI